MTGRVEPSITHTEHIARPRTSESGQDLVEFALILPLLLLILLGIIEFGIAILHYNSVANVSREIARFGIVNPSPTRLDDFIFTDDTHTLYTEDIGRWSRGLITDTDTLGIEYALNDATTFLSRTVQVTVTYEHEFITGPVIAVVGGDGTVDLRAVSTMNIELPFTN